MLKGSIPTAETTLLHIPGFSGPKYFPVKRTCTPSKIIQPPASKAIRVNMDLIIMRNFNVGSLVVLHTYVEISKFVQNAVLVVDKDGFNIFVDAVALCDQHL